MCTWGRWHLFQPGLQIKEACADWKWRWPKEIFTSATKGQKLRAALGGAGGGWSSSALADWSVNNLGLFFLLLLLLFWSLTTVLLPVVDNLCWGRSFVLLQVKESDDVEPVGIFLLYLTVQYPGVTWRWHSLLCTGARRGHSILIFPKEKSAMKTMCP